MKKIVLGVLTISACYASAFADEAGNGVVSNIVTVSERMVFVDPETGKIIPGSIDPSELPVNESSDKTQSRSISLSGVASEPQLMPDGSRKIEFNGQFMRPIKVEIGEDGSVQAGHHIGASTEQSKR